MMHRNLAVTTAALAAACSGAAPTQRAGAPAAASRTATPGLALAPELAEQARAGVVDQELAALLVDHWDVALRSSPVRATTMGDHRFDDRIADNSQAALDQRRADRDAFAARASAIPAERLGPADRLTHALFIHELVVSKAVDACELHLWSVSPRGNPITGFNILPQRHKVVSVEDGRNLVARYRHVAASIDTTIAHLRTGATRGLVANSETLRRTLAMADGQLAQPVSQWALMAPVAAERAEWTDAQRAAFAAELAAVVEGEILPAYQRYRDVVAELAVKGRGPDQVGLVGLPIGEACYEALVQSYTGLPKTAAELHETGLRELAGINREMTELGFELFGTRDLAAIVERMRTDKSLYFDNPQDIVTAANSALSRARNRMASYFGILPEASCVVVEIPAYEAPYSTIAYYRRPHADGSKPGEYFINTHEPTVRPRFEMEVLAYHEAIPGHHLQVAIAQERDALPSFRRFGGNTAFVEGWALYTERLSGEMGLYTGKLDVMGMLSYDAWRASRLVVDTGIHAMGWTRKQAEDYMLAHTALTAANIRNEVDRYIATPGQAVAYKTGQLEIMRLRELARRKLGAAFDIKAFHDAVLRNGGVTLPALEQAVLDYIAAAN